MIVFGNSEITQCSSNDLIYSTSIAKQMVTMYGFSVMGPVSLDQNKEEVFLGNSLLRNKSTYSEETSKQIDKEVMNISKSALQSSIAILKRNRKLLDKLVDVLIEEETINKDRFQEISSRLLNV